MRSIQGTRLCSAASTLAIIALSLALAAWPGLSFASSAGPPGASPGLRVNLLGLDATRGLPNTIAPHFVSFDGVRYDYQGQGDFLDCAVVLSFDEPLVNDDWIDAQSGSARLKGVELKVSLSRVSDTEVELSTQLPLSSLSGSDELMIEFVYADGETEMVTIPVEVDLSLYSSGASVSGIDPETVTIDSPDQRTELVISGEGFSQEWLATTKVTVRGWNPEKKEEIIDVSPPELRSDTEFAVLLGDLSRVSTFEVSISGNGENENWVFQGSVEVSSAVDSGAAGGGPRVAAVGAPKKSFAQKLGNFSKGVSLSIPIVIDGEGFSGDPLKDGSIEILGHELTHTLQGSKPSITNLVVTPTQITFDVVVVLSDDDRSFAPTGEGTLELSVWGDPHEIAYETEFEWPAATWEGGDCDDSDPTISPSSDGRLAPGSETLSLSGTLSGDYFPEDLSRLACTCSPAWGTVSVQSFSAVTESASVIRWTLEVRVDRIEMKRLSGGGGSPELPLSFTFDGSEVASVSCPLSVVEPEPEAPQFEVKPLRVDGSSTLIVSGGSFSISDDASMIVLSLTGPGASEDLEIGGASLKVGGRGMPAELSTLTFTCEPGEIKREKNGFSLEIACSPGETTGVFDPAKWQKIKAIPATLTLSIAGSDRTLPVQIPVVIEITEQAPLLKLIVPVAMDKGLRFRSFVQPHVSESTLPVLSFTLEGENFTEDMVESVSISSGGEDEDCDGFTVVVSSSTSATLSCPLSPEQFENLLSSDQFTRATSPGSSSVSMICTCVCGDSVSASFDFPVDIEVPTPEFTAATVSVSDVSVDDSDASSGNTVRMTLDGTVTGVALFSELMLDTSFAVQLEDGSSIELQLDPSSMEFTEDGSSISFSQPVSYVLKKEEGGRHTPFHNKLMASSGGRTVEAPFSYELEMPVLAASLLSMEVVSVSPIDLNDEDSPLSIVVRVGVVNPNEEFMESLALSSISIDELNIDIREMTTGMDVDYKTYQPGQPVYGNITFEGSLSSARKDMLQWYQDMVTKGGEARVPISVSMVDATGVVVMASAVSPVLWTAPELSIDSMSVLSVTPLDSLGGSVSVTVSISGSNLDQAAQSDTSELLSGHNWNMEHDGAAAGRVSKVDSFTIKQGVTNEATLVLTIDGFAELEDMLSELVAARKETSELRSMLSFTGGAADITFECPIPISAALMKELDKMAPRLLSIDGGSPGGDLDGDGLPDVLFHVTGEDCDDMDPSVLSVRCTLGGIDQDCDFSISNVSSTGFDLSVFGFDPVPLQAAARSSSSGEVELECIVTLLSPDSAGAGGGEVRRTYAFPHVFDTRGRVSSVSVSSLSVADLDQDGRLDIIVSGMLEGSGIDELLPDLQLSLVVGSEVCDSNDLDFTDVSSSAAAYTATCVMTDGQMSDLRSSGGGGSGGSGGMLRVTLSSDGSTATESPVDLSPIDDFMMEMVPTGVKIGKLLGVNYFNAEGEFSLTIELQGDNLAAYSPGKQKTWNPANFRLTLRELPCEVISVGEMSIDPATGAGQLELTGKVSVQDLVVMKRLDKSSPLLMRCAVSLEGSGTEFEFEMPMDEELRRKVEKSSPVLSDIVVTKIEDLDGDGMLDVLLAVSGEDCDDMEDSLLSVSCVSGDYEVLARWSVSNVRSSGFDLSVFGFDPVEISSAARSSDGSAPEFECVVSLSDGSSSAVRTFSFPHVLETSGRITSVSFDSSAAPPAADVDGNFVFSLIVEGENLDSFAAGKQKAWLPSNFRLSLGDLPASVNKIESFTIKQGAVSQQATLVLSGKVSLQDISFMKRIDKSSPLLMRCVSTADGEDFSSDFELMLSPELDKELDKMNPRISSATCSPVTGDPDGDGQLDIVSLSCVVTGENLDQVRPEDLVVSVDFGDGAVDVSLQGFVVNSHTSGFDLSVFGFEPQPIAAAARKAGGEQQPYLTIRLSDVMVSSLQLDPQASSASASFDLLNYLDEDDDDDGLDTADEEMMLSSFSLSSLSMEDNGLTAVVSLVWSEAARKTEGVDDWHECFLTSYCTLPGGAVLSATLDASTIAAFPDEITLTCPDTEAALQMMRSAGWGDDDDCDGVVSMEQVVAPRDSASGLATGRRERGSGLATGRRTYEPITFRKRIDKMVPTARDGSVDDGQGGELLLSSFSLSSLSLTEEGLTAQVSLQWSDSARQTSSDVEWLECFLTSYCYLPGGAVLSATMDAATIFSFPEQITLTCPDTEAALRAMLSSGWLEDQDCDGEISMEQVLSPRDSSSGLATGRREKGSGLATGRRTFEPIVFRKRIDKSSPLLMREILDPDDDDDGLETSDEEMLLSSMTLSSLSLTDGRLSAVVSLEWTQAAQQRSPDYNWNECFLTSYAMLPGGGSLSATLDAAAIASFPTEITLSCPDTEAVLQAMRSSGWQDDEDCDVTLSMEQVLSPRDSSSGLATGRREKGSGLATGRRTYEPIVFHKRIDKSTPLLRDGAVDDLSSGAVEDSPLSSASIVDFGVDGGLMFADLTLDWSTALQSRSPEFVNGRYVLRAGCPLSVTLETEFDLDSSSPPQSLRLVEVSSVVDGNSLLSIVDSMGEESTLQLEISLELISPRDAASGLPTGKRQHKPFTITKEIDKGAVARSYGGGGGTGKVSVRDFSFSRVDGKSMAAVSFVLDGSRSMDDGVVVLTASLPGGGMLSGECTVDASGQGSCVCDVNESPGGADPLRLLLASGWSGGQCEVTLRVTPSDSLGEGASEQRSAGGGLATGRRTYEPIKFSSSLDVPVVLSSVSYAEPSFEDMGDGSVRVSCPFTLSGENLDLSLPMCFVTDSLTGTELSCVVTVSSSSSSSVSGSFSFPRGPRQSTSLEGRREFNLLESWPCKWSVSELDASKSSTIVEELEFAVEKVERARVGGGSSGGGPDGRPTEEVSFSALVSPLAQGASSLQLSLQLPPDSLSPDTEYELRCVLPDGEVLSTVFTSPARVSVQIVQELVLTRVSSFDPLVLDLDGDGISEMSCELFLEEVSSTREQGTGLATGRRQYQPLLITVPSSSASGDADDRPTEEVAFYFTKIDWKYSSEDRSMVDLEVDFEVEGSPEQLAALYGATLQIACPQCWDGDAAVVVEYSDGDDPLTHKRAGKAKYKNIVLKRGLVNDSFSVEGVLLPDQQSPLLSESSEGTKKIRDWVKSSYDGKSMRAAWTIDTLPPDTEIVSPEAGLTSGGDLPTESLSLNFTKIEWLWQDGGVTAVDDWETPVAMMGGSDNDDWETPVAMQVSFSLEGEGLTADSLQDASLVFSGESPAAAPELSSSDLTLTQDGAGRVMGQATFSGIVVSGGLDTSGVTNPFGGTFAFEASNPIPGVGVVIKKGSSRVDLSIAPPPGSTGGGGLPPQSLSLNFTKIEFDYKDQKSASMSLEFDVSGEPEMLLLLDGSQLEVSGGNLLLDSSSVILPVTFDPPAPGESSRHGRCDHQDIVVTKHLDSSSTSLETEVILLPPTLDESSMRSASKGRKDMLQWLHNAAEGKEIRKTITINLRQHQSSARLTVSNQPVVVLRDAFGNLQSSISYEIENSGGKEVDTAWESVSGGEMIIELTETSTGADAFKTNSPGHKTVGEVTLRGAMTDGRSSAAPPTELMLHVRLSDGTELSAPFSVEYRDQDSDDDGLGDLAVDSFSFGKVIWTYASSGENGHTGVLSVPFETESRIKRELAIDMERRSGSFLVTSPLIVSGGDLAMMDSVDISTEQGREPVKVPGKIEFPNLVISPDAFPPGVDEVTIPLELTFQSGGSDSPAAAATMHWVLEVRVQQVRMARSAGGDNDSDDDGLGDAPGSDALVGDITRDDILELDEVMTLRRVPVVVINSEGVHACSVELEVPQDTPDSPLQLRMINADGRLRAFSSPEEVMSSVQDNPLFTAQGMSGDNPLFEGGNDMRQAPGGGSVAISPAILSSALSSVPAHAYIVQYEESDLDFIRACRLPEENGVCYFSIGGEGDFAEVSAYFNPKEISIDKSVPWNTIDDDGDGVPDIEAAAKVNRSGDTMTGDLLLRDEPGTDISVVPPAAGTYVFDLTVLDDNGISSVSLTFDETPEMSAAGVPNMGARIVQQRVPSFNSVSLSSQEELDAFLVNQGMEGNAHPRFDAVEVRSVLSQDSWESPYLVLPEGASVDSLSFALVLDSSGQFVLSVDGGDGSGGGGGGGAAAVMFNPREYTVTKSVPWDMPGGSDSRAEGIDYNSSRSNKSNAVDEPDTDLGNDGEPQGGDEELAGDGSGGTRAEGIDYNSSRSNKTSGLAEPDTDTGNEGEPEVGEEEVASDETSDSRAEGIDYNSSRSNKSNAVEGPAGGGGAGGQLSSIFADLSVSSPDGSSSRVKVQFHWDRTPAGESTGWARLAEENGSPVSFIPETTDEVLIAFESGNTPIIKGSALRSSLSPIVIGSMYGGEAAPGGAVTLDGSATEVPVSVTLDSVSPVDLYALPLMGSNGSLVLVITSDMSMPDGLSLCGTPTLVLTGSSMGSPGDALEQEADSVADRLGPANGGLEQPGSSSSLTMSEGASWDLMSLFDKTEALRSTLDTEAPDYKSFGDAVLDLESGLTRLRDSDSMPEDAMQRLTELTSLIGPIKTGSTEERLFAIDELSGGLRQLLESVAGPWNGADCGPYTYDELRLELGSFSSGSSTRGLSIPAQEMDGAQIEVIEFSLCCRKPGALDDGESFEMGGPGAADEFVEDYDCEEITTSAHIEVEGNLVFIVFDGPVSVDTCEACLLRIGAEITLQDGRVISAYSMYPTSTAGTRDSGADSSSKEGQAIREYKPAEEQLKASPRH